MAFSMVTGSTGSQNILSNLRVVDMADKIYLLQPEAAPLYVLVSKLNKRVAINTTFQWPEDDLNPSWSTLTTSATSAQTNFITVTNEGSYFNVYDLIKFPSTGEICLVQTVAACGVTAVRGFAGTTAASAAANATVVILGSAFAEGSAYSDLTTLSRVATNAYNYLQLFRKSVQVTNTMLNSELYGGNYRAYERKVKGIELMRDLERVFLFGGKLEDTSLSVTGGVRRTTGGAQAFIATNVTAIGGILAEADFEAFIRTVTRFGGDEIYLFASPLIISVISQWAQGKLQMFPKDYWIVLIKSPLIDLETWRQATGRKKNNCYKIPNFTTYISRGINIFHRERLSEETLMKRCDSLACNNNRIEKLQINKAKTYGMLYAVVKSSYMTGKSCKDHNTNEVKIYGERQSAGKRHSMVGGISGW